MVYMSRDGRKVINHLLSLSGEKIPTKEDIIQAEQLVFTYYSKTIIGHITRFYNPDSKNNPNRVAFYVKPTKSINKGKRTTEEWIMTDEDREKYFTIGEYVIEDYSIDQLKIIRDLCKYQLKDIKVAIKESQKENIYSIFYLQRVVEGIVTQKEYERSKKQYLKELYKYNEKTDIINRTPLEIATMEYTWQNSVENLELRRKMEELYNDDK